MSHQPFEAWLLSEETLPPEQAAELRAHLRDCLACQQLDASWAGVRQLFKSAAPVTPASGFTARWQARLAEQQRKLHRRNSLIMLAFTGGTAAILFALVGFYGVQMLNASESWLVSLVYRATMIYAYLEVTGDVVTSIWRTLLLSVPLPVWVFLPGIMCFLLVLWLVTFRQLTSIRRTAQ